MQYAVRCLGDFEVHKTLNRRRIATVRSIDRLNPVFILQVHLSVFDAYPFKISIDIIPYAFHRGESKNCCNISLSDKPPVHQARKDPELSGKVRTATIPFCRACMGSCRKSKICKIGGIFRRQRSEKKIDRFDV
jgi:hypothetical protein